MENDDLLILPCDDLRFEKSRCERKENELTNKKPLGMNGADEREVMIELSRLRRRVAQIQRLLKLTC